MAVPVHYLRANASEWTPNHLIFLDTETYPEGNHDTQLLRMRLWVGGVVTRKAPGATSLSVRTAHGFDRRSLARWVDGATTGQRTTWLYTHNLGFDLTVSRLPDFLHRLGWTATEWHLAGRNVTGRMGKRSKRLTLADSVSLMPTNLESIGLAVGRRKLPMPDQAAAEEDWLAYCENDMLVLAESVLTLLDWWDANHLGHWTTGGPGCGWNSLRHMTQDRMFLIRTDELGVKADRMAVRGGRRDVTRVGPIPGGPFALVDFSNAYLTVAAHHLLPKGRLGFYPGFELDSIWVDGNRFGVIAECEVDTPTPRYPLRTDRGVFYPVGRFRTTLASPEIVWAREAGHLISIGPGWVHDLGYPLAMWARWVLELLDPTNGQVPAVVRIMAKQWGRSVVGKFAARASRSIDRGPALWPGWHLERGSSGPDHVPASDLHIAGRHWWIVSDLESDNSYPAVLAWVESYVRVALGRMLEAMGEELWVCCDTDGAVLDLTQARGWLRGAGVRLGRTKDPFKVAEAVCGAVAPLCWPLVPRVKLLSETLNVSGPQHYQGDTFERAAGRPSKPEVGSSGALQWWRWPSLRWQMEHGSPLGFVRTETTWTHPSQLAHRWVLADGTAKPVEATVPVNGEGPLVPWDVSPYGELGWLLAYEQAPALRGLHTGG